MRMRTFLFLLAALTAGAGWSEARAQAVGEGRAQLTRAELQRLLSEYSTAAASTAYSEELRARARRDAEAVRARLEEGDFQVGDQIALMVEGEEALSGTLIVQAGPSVVLPTIGSISLRGVLRSELEPHLQQQIARYVRNPLVRARSSIRVVITGAVGKPGYHVVPADAVLSDVLMTAGGPHSDADLRRLRIQRQGRVIREGDGLQQALVEGRTLDQLGFRAGDEILLPRPGSGRWPAVRTVLLSLSSIAGLITILTR